MSLYKQTIELVGCRKQFFFNDVCRFQQTANDICDLYCYLTGRNGIKYYLNLLRSGHCVYFLLKRCDLFKYPEQGWEAVNGKMKCYFNHNAQKGEGKKGSSKLLPIFMTFFRRFLWRCGILDQYFEKVNQSP